MLKSLPLTALVAALALAGCNQAPKTTDNVAVDVDNAVAPDDSTLNEAPVVEDAADATAVTVAAVPKAAPGTAAADAAPLHDAGTIEDEIRDGKNVQRIRYGDGWAWTRGGKVVRTADRDGKEVAYFRPGESKPFFVQKGDRSYAFKGGKPDREFDGDGKARAPDADRAKEADEVANKAHDRRGQAEQARDHARDNPKGDGPKDNGPRDNGPKGNDGPKGDDNAKGDRDDHRGSGASPSPTPTASPMAGDHGGRDRNRGDRDHN